MQGYGIKTLLYRLIIEFPSAMNHKLRYALIALVTLVSIACVFIYLRSSLLDNFITLGSSRFYRASEVIVHAEGIVDGAIELQFSVPAETMFVCPGVTVEQQNGFLDVYFHRVHFENRASPAKIPISIGTNGHSSVKIPYDIHSGEPVQLRLNGTKALGKWKLGG